MASILQYLLTAMPCKGMLTIMSLDAKGPSLWLLCGNNLFRRSGWVWWLLCWYVRASAVHMRA